MPTAGKAALQPWEPDHFIRRYAEVVRDRLILGFELKNLVHKPKLVAVTGVTGGEGTSTLASGLAAALSETGDGKVLLVDMTAKNPEMRRFIEGNAAGSLAEALESGREVASPGENLYVVTGNTPNGTPRAIAPKRFYDMMPALRASDFDYIIFDMPPVDQSGATLAISGHMDKVVLMVEADKSNQVAVKRVYEELVAAKADVAGVLNMASNSGPEWLQG